MTGDNAARRAEDIGGQELSYAEVKAIASGNPAVLTLAEADAELQRLTILKKNHADEQYLARRNLRVLPDTIERLSERLAGLTAGLATANEHEADRITIAGRSCSRDETTSALAASLDALPHTVREIRRFPLGVYRGLRFGLVLHPHWAPEVYLEGATTRQDRLSRDHHGPRAVLNALERLASGYGPECASVRRELEIAETQLRDYQARLGQPFAHDAYLARLTSLRDQLKAGLSGAAPEPGSEAPPSVPELAEQIKSLKAAYSIDAAPERVGRRSSTAEVPVTARIRRRAEMVPPAEPAIEPNVAGQPSGTAPPPGTSAPAAAEPPLPSPAHHAGPNGTVSGHHEATYRERVAAGPARQERQRTLF